LKCSFTKLYFDLLTPDFNTSWLSVAKDEKVLLGQERWIWQDGRTAPDGNPVDRRKTKLTGYFGFGLAGNILFRSSFLS